MELKIAQINAQRSAAVAADLRTALSGANIDILCVQEPYSLDGVVRGYGLRTRIFQSKTNAPMAAIIVENDNLDILQLSMESSHIIALQVITTFYEFYLVSVYFSFRTRWNHT